MQFLSVREARRLAMPPKAGERVPHVSRAGSFSSEAVQCVALGLIGAAAFYGAWIVGGLIP